MRTVVIWDNYGAEPVRFFVVDRDLKHLNNKYVNSTDCDMKDWDEISSLVYDDEGKKVIDLLEEFPVDEVKNGAQVIVCGFIP